MGSLLRVVAALMMVVALSACTWRPPTGGSQTAPSSAARPNILLVTAEDLSPRIGAYGDPVAHTPTLDRLAAEGVRFDSVFTTAGVCAPSRSALITGVYQQTLGTMHMRTGSWGRDMDRGFPYEAVPPAAVKAFPELLRAAGYWTANDAKTDYQFGDPFTVWDANGPEADWTGREEGQPFFAMINFFGTHESFTWPPDVKSDHPSVSEVSPRNRAFDQQKEHSTDPAEVRVPAYYPDTPLVRENIARHYDNIAVVDRQIGALLDRLEAEGLADNTIVIFTTDHGDGLPRAKRMIFDSGTHVPLIVRWPDGRNAGGVRDDLVSFVDLAPTILTLAGASVPDWVQGRVFLGPTAAAAPDFVFSASDRLDEVPGRMRSARGTRFRYVRNHHPEQPLMPSLGYQNVNPITASLRRSLPQGTLPATSRAFLAAPSPPEMLFDLETDPDEVRNLAAVPEYAAVLDAMREAVDAWIDRTGDLGRIEESQLVERMWPGGEQPVTEAPAACLTTDERVRLSSKTPGASIGWSDGDRSILYTDPLAVVPVSARAIRYGYARSATVTVDAAALGPCARR